MATESLLMGRRHFRISTVPVWRDGRTISVVHRVKDGGATVEIRNDSDVVYESEENAIEPGHLVARDIAERCA